MLIDLVDSPVAKVALRKESVDRNDEDDPDNLWSEWSLSARRAWIEMPTAGQLGAIGASLSARRAWIEILARHRAGPQK